MEGAEMKDGREQAGLRALEVAKELEVRVETVSRWETGKVGVPAMAAKLFGQLVGDAERIKAIKGGRRQRVLAEGKQRRLAKLSRAESAEGTVGLEELPLVKDPEYEKLRGTLKTNLRSHGPAGPREMAEVTGIPVERLMRAAEGMCRLTESEEGVLRSMFAEMEGV